MSHKFNDAQAARDFFTAGQAIVTIESEVTGCHLTYRINQADDQPDLWFVSLLTGPNNLRDYTYMGILAGPRFRLTAKSRYRDDSRPVRAFVHVWERLTDGRMPAKIVIRHEGRCGRCARALTVPESIDRGIGPECASKMGE